MSNIVYIATSIDGYIAKVDGSINWLTEIPNPDNSDYGFSEFLKGIDAILMGRKTFEAVLGFDEWPFEKPVFVLSNSLSELHGRWASKAEIIKGDLKEVIKLLNNKGIINLYIDGGKTINSFLSIDLIDEMIITVIPILLGTGIHLFDDGGLELRFKHVETNVYNGGLVKTKYVREHGLIINPPA